MSQLIGTISKESRDTMQIWQTAHIDKINECKNEVRRTIAELCDVNQLGVSKMGNMGNAIIFTSFKDKHFWLIAASGNIWKMDDMRMTNDQLLKKDPFIYEHDGRVEIVCC